MAQDTRVLYNGECPVCRFEITHYERYAGKNALPIHFDDLTCGGLAEWGLTQDDAARRLYVLKHGALLSGIPAFLALWDDMPRYRWLAHVVRCPGVRQVFELLYERVAAPLLYRQHLKRQRRAETKC